LGSIRAVILEEEGFEMSISKRLKEFEWMGWNGAGLSAPVEHREST